MVIRHMDGFDKYTANASSAVTELTRAWNTVTVTGTGTAVAAAGRYTGQCIQLENVLLSKTITVSGKHFITCNLKANSSTTPDMYIRFGTDCYVRFYYDMMAGWSLETKYGGTANDDGLVVDFADGSWYCVEIQLDASGATDNLVYINEVNYSQHTEAFTHGGYVKYDVGDGSAGTYYWSLDHHGTWDNSGSSGYTTRLGGSWRVETLLPNADSTPEQWITVGQASAYLVLDNVPTVPTEFVKALADNDVIQLGFSNLADTPADDIAVQFNTLALNVDPGNLKTLKFVMDDSGTATEVGTGTDPASTLTFKQEVLAINPITTAVWQTSEVNALVAGLKRLA